MALRIALSIAPEIGRSVAASPDHVSWRGVAAIAATASALWLTAPGFSSPGSGTTSLLCLALLMFGLPHGSFDIALVRHSARLGRGQVAAVVLLYIGLAAATYAVWRIAPVVALAGFLIVAIVHFAEDWADRLPTFFAVATAVALLTAPALLHHHALADIFVQLTGQEGAAILADAALLIAPVSVVATGVGIVLLVRDGHAVPALETGSTIVGMALLPPVVGFAIFFCLIHSPRHFAAARAQLRGRDREAVVISCAAFGIAALIYAARGAPLENGAIFASFVTLSVLTVPHMIVPRIVNRQRAKALC